MSFRDLLTRWTGKNPAASYKNFDQKLVSGVKPRRLPTWQQLRYVGRFLDKREKSIMLATAGVAMLTAIIWTGVTIKNHITIGPKNGGEYTEGMVGQPKYLNPIFSTSNEVDSDLTPLIYSGLFRYSADEKLIGDLASGYTVSADKKIYTVTLRQDVKWSDGEPFDADDVVYTFETIQNPEVGSPLASAFQGIKVEKIDDYTVSFSLKEPFAPFLTTLTVGMIPEHIWSEIAPSSMRLAKNNIQPVGSGQWKFEKMVKDDTGMIQSYTLSANDKYYQKIPYIKSLTFKFYTDYEQAFEALRGQNILAVSFLPNNFIQKISAKSFINHSLSLPQYTALFFNENQLSDLKSADVRRALAMAVDKSDLIKTTLADRAMSIDSPILPGQLGYYPDIARVEYAPDAANTLLDKSYTRIQPEEFFQIKSAEALKSRQAEIDALKKNPSTTPDVASSSIAAITDTINETVRADMTPGQVFYRKSKDGKILSITITTADTPEYQKVAEFVAKSWRALGVHAVVSTVSARQINREAIKDRSYQVLLYAEMVGSDSDLYPFWHSSQTDYPGLNLSGYANRTADKVLEDARVATDTSAREKLHRQFQEMLVKDLPAIFLYTLRYNFVAAKEVHGINVTNILSAADRYGTIGDWYIKTRWEWK